MTPLPARRTTDYTEARVLVTRSGGFSFDKVFYTVPSRFIGHHLKLRVYDDRLECLLGSSHVLTLRRGRAPGNGRGKRGHVVSYHHVIAGLRRKPQALANLVYRDDLFPRRAFADTWDALTTALDQRRDLGCPDRRPRPAPRLPRHGRPPVAGPRPRLRGRTGRCRRASTCWPSAHPASARATQSGRCPPICLIEGAQRLQNVGKDQQWRGTWSSDRQHARAECVTRG